MELEYADDEEVAAAEDLGLLDEAFDEAERYLDGISQLRINDEE